MDGKNIGKKSLGKVSGIWRDIEFEHDLPVNSRVQGTKADKRHREGKTVSGGRKRTRGHTERRWGETKTAKEEKAIYQKEMADPYSRLFMHETFASVFQKEQARSLSWLFLYVSSRLQTHLRFPYPYRLLVLRRPPNQNPLR